MAGPERDFPTDFLLRATRIADFRKRYEVESISLKVAELVHNYTCPELQRILKRVQEILGVTL